MAELSALATLNVSGAPYVALRRHSTRSGQSSCARSARSERRLAARERQGVGASSERLKRRYALSLGELFIRGAGELVQQARSRYDAGSSRACAVSLLQTRAKTHIGASIFEWKQKWTAFVVECGWSRVFSVRAARRVRAVSTPHSREKLLSPSFVRRSSTASPSNRRDASTSAPPRRVASTTSARNDARRRRHLACSGAWPAVARRYRRSSTPLDTTLEHHRSIQRWSMSLNEDDGYGYKKRAWLRFNDVRMPRCLKRILDVFHGNMIS